MPVFKKLTLTALVLTVAFSFSACSIELYERMLIKGIGVDYKDDAYTVTVRVADLVNDGEKLITSTGLTVYDALNELSLQSGNKQMYTHSSYVIFGKAAAEKGIDDSIDFFLRYFKSNPTIEMFVAEDTAAKVLETKSDGKLAKSEEIKNLTKSQKYCGKVVESTLLSFVSEAREYGRTSIMPVIGSTGEGFDISGTGLFKELQLVDSLTENETAGYLTAMGKQKGLSVVVKNEEYGEITGEILSTKTQLTFSEDFKTVNMEVEAGCLLASITVGKAIHDSDLSRIEEMLAQELKENTLSALDTSYKNGCDVLLLGYKLYTENTEFWKKSGEDWQNHIRELKFNVNVKVCTNKVGEENRPQF